MKTVTLELKVKDVEAIRDMCRLARSMARDTLHNWPHEPTPQNAASRSDWQDVERQADALSGDLNRLLILVENGLSDHLKLN